MSNANSRIGVEYMTFAKMLTDVDGGSSTYDTPWQLGKKLVKVGIKGKPTSEMQYADDVTVAVYTDDGDITLAIDITDLTEDEKALLLGQTVSSGIRTPAPTDIKPYWSVSFKSKKRNGNYKFYKFLKVIFEEPDETLETKKDKIAAQEDAITGNGIQRISDGLRKRIADQDSASYVAGTGSGWFTSGDISPDVAAPTVTVVPADGAIGQAVTVDIVWTFNEAIQSLYATNSYFMVVKADGTNVAGAITINAANTIVTFNPTASLDGGSTYIATASSAIKDVSGNALANPSVTNFATT